MIKNKRGFAFLVMVYFFSHNLCASALGSRLSRSALAAQRAVVVKELSSTYLPYSSRSVDQHYESDKQIVSSRFSLKGTGIKLIVSDMAGTVVNEGGLVYKTLYQSMQESGVELLEDEMDPWHGAQKKDVIAHFCQRQYPHISSEALIQHIETIHALFISKLQEGYFKSNSGVCLMSEAIPELFTQLRAKGIQIALNTGYPSVLQKGLIHHLNLENLIDEAVSASEVAHGRPNPDMIFCLMSRLNIIDSRQVLKIGDTVRDIEEGRNAACGLTVGVLSGADSAESLKQAGADVIIPDISCLEF